MLNSSSWFLNNPTFYNGVATQSARFDDGSSAYLTRTPSASNRKTHTLSMWVKRCELGGGSVNNSLFRANGAGDTGRTDIWFDANDKLNVAGSSTYFRITNRQFRDVSSWYHIVFALDTTDGTADNRLKIYVNGVQETSFATNNAYSQNTDYGINGNVAHQIGTGYAYFDGYMAEINFVDGSQLDPTSFGEFKNGVWIPIEYTGSYGTNGFRLQFNQTGTGTGSTTTIGADTSGNNNHWTSSGIVASDCAMPDSPENNFATVNPLARRRDVTTLPTFSEGNLKAVFPDVGGNVTYGVGTIPALSGKFYYEVHITNSAFGNIIVGIGTENDYAESGVNTLIMYYRAGGIYKDGSLITTGASYTTGDIISCAYDLDNNTVSFYKNNSLQHTVTGVTSRLYVPFTRGKNSDTLSYNFGQDSSFAGNKTAQGNTDGNGNGDFYYSPPSSFLALCTTNLPETTISPNADTQADDYFTPTLYTSNNIGAGGTQSITGVGFQPDWVWIKNRSSDSTSHTLFDSVRTAGKMLQSDNATVEASNSQYGYLSSFDSDGFTLTGGTTNANFINQGTDAYVSWGWKASGGTIATNTDGTITSSVSANTDAGFSVVGYTGTDSATETIGHGLGAVPAMLIIKSRDSALNWAVYHKGVDATAPEDYLLRLNTTDARVDVTSAWNDTAPTSSVFTVGTSSLVNNTDDFIAYCFAEIEGYSKFGGYTGNDSTDGNFIYLGFRPSFIIIKYTSGTAGGTKNWFMFDDARDTFNPTDDTFNANAPDGETANSNKDLDFLSNGFKIRNAEGAINNGAEYIYMAFAKTPFKYANAR